MCFVFNDTAIFHVLDQPLVLRTHFSLLQSILKLWNTICTSLDFSVNFHLFLSCQMKMLMLYELFFFLHKMQGEFWCARKSWIFPNSSSCQRLVLSLPIFSLSIPRCLSLTIMQKALGLMHFLSCSEIMAAYSFFRWEKGKKKRPQMALVV